MPAKELPQAVSVMVAHLDESLRQAGIRERAEREKRYLKSDLSHYGVPVPVVRRASKALLRRVGRVRDADVLSLAEALWSREVHELRLAAVELLVHQRGELGAGALPLLERMLREGRTWALVDPLAIHVVGPLVQRHPHTASPALSRWARDGNLWLRRSALLAHLLRIRDGDADGLAAFFEIADGLLEDGEFFVRKAIGWVLREGTKRLPDAVFAWLLPRAGRASSLTLREASKHLPAGQKEALRRRGRRPTTRPV